MVYIKPILQTIKAFDATKEQSLSFRYAGNIQGSTLRIYRKQNTETSYSYWKQDINMSIHPVHIIEADTLENGYQYKATVTVSYTSGEGISQQSESSDPIYFNCYATPICQIVSLSPTEDNLLSISEFNSTLQITNCSGQVPIRANVSVYLDKTCTQFYCNKTYHDFTQSANSYNCSISLHSLESSKTNALLGVYYILVECITDYDMEFSSAIYKIVVDYKENLPSVLQAEVDNGHVNLTVKDYKIDGYFIPSQGKSTVANGSVSVASGENLNYDVNLVNDFCITLKALSPVEIDDVTPIIELYGDDDFHLQIIGELRDYNVKELAATQNLNDRIWANVRFVLLTNDRNKIVRYSNALSVFVVKSGNAKYRISLSSVVFNIKRINGYYSITWSS